MMRSNMKNLAILLAVLAVALGPSAALAKNDKTPPGLVANSDKPDPPGQTKQGDKSDPPGQTKQGDQHDPPGQNKGDDKSDPPGQTKNNDGSEAIPDDPSTAEEVTEAQRAVASREALPLARIITIAETGTTGRVINARLTRVDGTLLYQLTFLDDSGRSWREYFYARTGNPVIIR